MQPCLHDSAHDSHLSSKFEESEGLLEDSFEEGLTHSCTACPARGEFVHLPVARAVRYKGWQLSTTLHITMPCNSWRV